MNKQISIRELILLGLLVVIAVYYFAVQGPVNRESKLLEEQLATIQAEADIKSIKAAEAAHMKQEIAAAKEKAGGQANALPEYNNLNNIIQELHLIFGDSEDFTVAFQDTSAEGSILRRKIMIKCMVPTEEAAMEKLKAVDTSPNTYLIQDCAVAKTETSRNNAAGEKQNAYQLTLNVTSFEYVPVGFQ